MKKLFFLIFCIVGFSFPALAEKTTDGQTILLCPKEIVCTSSSIATCHLSDNPFDMWNSPKYSGKLIQGIYKLKEVRFSEYKLPDCHYFINEKQPAPIRVSYDINTNDVKEYYYFNRFTPFLTESSKWSGDNVNNYKCLADNPSLCPLVEIPEITILSNAFYYPNTNTDTDFEPNFVIFNSLSYDQLLKKCGVTSNCIIDIGYCDSTADRCSHLGIVSLDISVPNIVKIDRVLNDSSNSSCNLKKKEPFNTIYCDPKMDSHYSNLLE